MSLRQHPLQVWLPRLGPQRWDGSVARDGQRAFDRWQGEHVVYLLPDLRREERFGGPEGMRILALPAEHLERVDIFHVGRTGGVWGPEFANRFPGGSITQLLPIWLTKGRVNPSYVLLARALSVRMPAVRRGRLVKRKRDGAVAFERLKYLPDPGPIVEMRISSRKSFTMRLTPPKSAAVVSPDAESLAAYCPAAADWHGFPGAIGPDGRPQPAFLVRWPWPWNTLIPVFDGHDPLVTQHRMRELERLALTDQPAAVRSAESAVASLISEATSTLGLAEFRPTYVSALAATDSPVRPFWETWGIEARDINAAMRDPRLDDPVPVRRVWGGLGLLWILLLERFRDGAVGHCERCGAPMRTRRQRVCRSIDNEACHRAQRRDAKARERSRARTAT